MLAAAKRVLGRLVLPADNHDEKLQKQVQVAMALASVPVVGTWGLTFVLAGHARLGITHAFYCLATVALVALCLATRRFELFSTPHLLLEMSCPFVLHWLLGGYLGSGGAFIWCLLAPMVSTMFRGTRQSIPWFVAMIALAIVGLWAPGPVVLTPDQLRFQFAFNTIGFVAFLFLSTSYFMERIEGERGRSERLLLNVLPKRIANRLKREEGTIADRFEHVTVLFSDIAGFTPLSARLNPEELVRLLDEVFSAFDGIADRFGLEKIKTIGDAYMLVGGLPEPYADHAHRVANAALAMRDFTRNLAHERSFEIAMRIGIHSGAVVAGVIGRRKFAYDLWGDTVNIASRMESHGEPGRVHASEATRTLLGESYVFEDRGVIRVKGKGEMRTFWLDAARS